VPARARLRGRHNITTTSSQSCAARRRSWVMKMTAVPCCFCIPAMRRMIGGCAVTSSAVVGSSAMTRRGSLAKAKAMSTRWHMPPESWCGYRSSRVPASGSSAAASMASARWRRSARPCCPSRARCSSNCRPMIMTGLSAVRGACGMNVIERPSSARRRRGAMRMRSRPSNDIDPAAIAKPGGSIWAIARPTIDFPAPDSPTRPMILPGARSNESSRTAGTVASSILATTVSSLICRMSMAFA